MVTRDEVIKRLETVIDPELGVDVYNLGLVYRVEVAEESRNVWIEMTLTSAGCPLAESLPEAARRAVAEIPEVGEVKVALVWQPPWDPSRITESGRRRLGGF